MIPKLIAKTSLFDMPDIYGPGDNAEAEYYTFFAHKIWHETDGEIAWIKNQSKKPGLRIVK